MKLLPAALVLVFLAPSALAAPPEPDFPDELVALLGGWISAQEALIQPADRERPWFAEADGFLTRAKKAHADGHLREGMFHLETFHELLVSNRLIDEAAQLPSDGERRSFVLQRVAGTHEDAEEAWTAYRARLHAYDGQLRSLLTIEKALYSADLALTGIVTGSEYDLIAGEFPKESGFPQSYVYTLVRDTSTVILDLAWANDILTEATKEEGLPPRILDERWTNLTTLALTQLEGDPPAYLQALDLRARPVRENEEAILAVAVVLAEQRASRANGMQTIFGDASTRGKNVIADATRGMSKQFNNTSLDAPRSVGLIGIHTSDAIDRVRLTIEYVEQDKASLGVVIAAWSSLDHAAYATNALASLSPIAPPKEKETPFLGALLFVGVALAAIATRRRSPP